MFCINRTVVCLVTWPKNVSEAGGDPALIQTSLFFLFKRNFQFTGVYEQLVLHKRNTEVFVSSEQKTVKWSIDKLASLLKC